VQSARCRAELGEVAFRFKVTPETESGNRTAKKSSRATSEPGDHASIEGKARAEGLQA
jgi:hypothetical protein